MNYKRHERPTLVEKVKDLYKRQYTFREIGKLLNVSHETARKMLSTPADIDKNGQVK